MGSIVKTERDNKALQAALAEYLAKTGKPRDTQLGSLPWWIQSDIMQRAYALRKDFE